MRIGEFWVVVWGGGGYVKMTRDLLNRSTTYQRYRDTCLGGYLSGLGFLSVY